MATKRPLPPYLRGTLPRHRAREVTVLRTWLKTHDYSAYRFARELGMRPDRLEFLAYGQMLPDLIVAFLIQEKTKGGVPASCWLGTSLGRTLWKQPISTYWRTRAASEKKYREKCAAKRRST